MIKLLYSPPSPFSAKVVMAAALAGITLEKIVIQTGLQPDELTSVNPLGKIPCLITDSGEGIYDSRTITQHLNRLSGNVLFPRNPGERLEAERLEALADGICDCLLAHVYERRMRPQEKVHQPWLDLQWSKVVRALDLLDANPPDFGETPTVGHLALRATLAYLDLRFAGLWAPGRVQLQRWAAQFDHSFPELAALLPTQA